MPNFACFICQKAHLNPIELIKHLKSAHGTPPVCKFQCNEYNCKQIFYNIHRFQIHLKKRLKIEIRNRKSCKENSLALNIPIQKTNSSNQLVPIQDITSLKDSMIAFLLQLHSNTNFSRKDVFEIQNSLTVLISTPICEILRAISNFHENNSILEEVIKIISQPFYDLTTEYKFFKEIEKLDLYKHTQKYIVSDELSEVILNNNPTLTSARTEITLSDIPFQIKKFFESKGILEATLLNMKNFSENLPYTHFINSSFWQNSKKNNVTIPFFLYMDDFEINDPLGSKSGQQKICGIYYNFPSVPQYQLSKLSNIFVAGFVKFEIYKIVDLLFALHHF
ncbi:uncharacterized protein LOC126764109 [Bactrocera neohumeralis]|uniref:uncharacterized protein LOC126764109 n=1 Tax=Bactrocera neohumeralis TaxID=98809 RepID=UPI002165AD5C|nr:uncharacterized protein LOC126764109 [Bactrocera neohumeralis]